MPRRWWKTSSRPSSRPGLARDQLLDGIGDPVLVLDRSRAVLDLNAAAIRLAGSPGHWQGTPADALFPFLTGTDLTGPSGVQTTVIRTPGGSYDVRVWRVRAEGAAWLVVLRDVTDEQRASDERERFVRRSTELVSNVAQELRTPIATVQGALQLLLGGARTPLATEDQRLIENALRSCERAAQIVHDILDIAAIDTTRANGGRGEPVSVERLVIDALFDAGRLAAERSVRIETALDPDVPLVHGMHDRLVQACVEVVSRAVALSEPGSTVRVTSQRAEQAVLVSVVYQGPPLAAHENAQAALGVATALVAQQGGRLSIDAKAPGTTTFLITLRQSDDPRAQLPRVTTTRVFARQPPSSTAPEPPPPQAPTPAATPAGAEPTPLASAAVAGPPAILLADDDPDLRDVVSEALQAHGFDVLPAEDGDEALAILARTRVDVAILDLNMPSRNGIEVILAMRHGVHANVPILVLTGSVDERHAPDALGADALLTKPTDLRRLVQEVRRLLAR